MSQRSDDLARRRLDPPVREAEDGVAGELERFGLSPIVLERAAGPMEGEAVQLNDQALLWPEGVHLEVEDAGVRDRGRKAGVAAELEELLLQRGAGQVRIVGEGREKGT